MGWQALAADYDGTLAENGCVSPATVDALERLTASGVRRLLVTGREMDDIVRVFSRLDVFDRVVSENGAVIYTPSHRSERHLTPRPGEYFVDCLRRRNVHPLSVGRVIIGSSREQSSNVRDAICECGLDLQITCNKESIMILPRGIDKATGLAAALEELHLSSTGLVAVGDGENDIPMLKLADCGAAVAGAVDAVKEAADIVLTADAGAGVAELIRLMLRAGGTGLDDCRKKRHETTTQRGAQATESRVSSAL